MKAAQIKQYGAADQVAVAETTKPTAAPGQVLVEVAAASLNPFDTMVREGYLKDSVPLDLPVTLGGDIAGTIVEVGEGVDGFVVGETVYGQASAVAGNSGALAEFAATKSDQVAPAPAGITIQEAASLPLVGASALQALTDEINLKKDQKILIIGGAGSIGRIAIQIAKHLGAHVAATAAATDLDIVRAAGADEVFDYASQDYTTVLSGYDAAFDTAGGDELARMVKVLKDDGVAVSMVGQPEADRDIKTTYQMTQVNTARLQDLRRLVEDKVVTPAIGKVFDLQSIAQAFEARDSGSVTGKIVIAIK